ncbi:hypothetical protein [Spirosoma sordidisoli]|uniref:Uncharacterized protein n=1 Tax=Spirosoma sordidisoli TaxID=2502893 RepID=A0A4Q2USM7_9BACT|nr:hypothetical protein [Spirosoma sordidisoli]RYC70730.1 hypothetical protein EQG79_00830 [Spirosoma sordidisoli]
MQLICPVTTTTTTTRIQKFEPISTRLERTIQKIGLPEGLSIGVEESGPLEVTIAVSGSIRTSIAGADPDEFGFEWNSTDVEDEVSLTHSPNPDIHKLADEAIDAINELVKDLRDQADEERDSHDNDLYQLSTYY